MTHSGTANLPLHPGKCPAWLFPRMKKLSGAISETIICEFGVEEFMKRLADPYFLQSLGCVIGFDWHSSGLTATTLGALKASINTKKIGITFCGGKGKTSRKTPDEIMKFSQEYNLSTKKVDRLLYSSKICAKIDNSLVQDGYQLYHHSFAFDENGKWIVIQQGMNNNNAYARRYHWHSESFDTFIQEPHNAICCNKETEKTLDLTNKHNKKVQKTSVDIINDDEMLKIISKIISEQTQLISGQTPLNYFASNTSNNNNNRQKVLTMPKNHLIPFMQKRNIEMLKQAYEYQPKSYEELIALKGVGAKTVRSLALISELIYGEEITWKDPVKYSFAVGGKDKIPYEINKLHYDKTTDILETALEHAKIDQKSRLIGIKKLAGMYG